jgi:K+-transporting ATPase ATPase B chain
VRLNVIAKSGRAVEAAGDVHVLLLDKTGTITFGNRRCAAVVAAPGVSGKEVAEGALFASLADDTAEGKSIVEYLRALHPQAEPSADELTAVPFSAETRLSGVDYQGRVFRKGAVDSLRSKGCCGKPLSKASVSARPWVSTTPAINFTPWRSWVCAAWSMA